MHYEHKEVYCFSRRESHSHRSFQPFSLDNHSGISRAWIRTSNIVTLWVTLRDSRVLLVVERNNTQM